jgi:hypothetical protein
VWECAIGVCAPSSCVSWLWFGVNRAGRRGSTAREVRVTTYDITAVRHTSA